MHIKPKNSKLSWIRMRFTEVLWLLIFWRRPPPHSTHTISSNCSIWPCHGHYQIVSPDSWPGLQGSSCQVRGEFHNLSSVRHLSYFGKKIINTILQWWGRDAASYRGGWVEMAAQPASLELSFEMVSSRTLSYRNCCVFISSWKGYPTLTSGVEVFECFVVVVVSVRWILVNMFGQVSLVL